MISDGGYLQRFSLFPPGPLFFLLMWVCLFVWDFCDWLVLFDFGWFVLNHLTFGGFVDLFT